MSSSRSLLVVVLCSLAPLIAAADGKRGLSEAEKAARAGKADADRAAKADADKAGDKAASLRLRDDIDKRTKALTDFVSARQAELDDQAKKLASTDLFTQGLYKQIQNVAETEGYSLVINLKSSDTVMNSILWYSPTIDITADVIQALTGGKP